MPQFPNVSRPADLVRVLKELPLNPPAGGRLDASYYKGLGISAASGQNLSENLRRLGLIDAGGKLSEIGRSLTGGDTSGKALARLLTKAYAGLFDISSCPYLESDEEIFEYIKKGSGASNKQAQGMLETFRALCEAADFQELLSYDEVPPASESGKTEVASLQPQPNLHLTINLQIDPRTSDAKIDTIFKSMRKHLLRKRPSK